LPLQEAAKLHPLRQQMNARGYTEGWGIYAETLAQKLGVYHDDAVSEIGYYGWRAALANARRKAGAKFDLAWFHDQTLRFGPFPQSLLDLALSAAQDDSRHH
jgi:uncharacterized protein (DUF885 family)